MQKIESFAGLYDRSHEIGELHFIPAEERKVEELQLQLALAADVAGVTVSDIPLPEFGFLVAPLTAEEKRMIDSAFEEPVAHFITDWEDSIKKTPIYESGEKMVNIPEAFAKAGYQALFSQRTFHPACGEWGGTPKVFWAREQVVEKLLFASEVYNRIGLQMRFEDGFRPAGVQEGLYRMRVAITREEHPEWSDEMVVMEARTKTAGFLWNAGHKAGAAVDVTLHTLQGEPLDLGNEYPDGGVVVNLDCPFITFEQFRTRQLFSQVMRMIGMSVYPGEDWHASYGDALAAMDLPDITEYTAQYGPVERFTEDGTVIPYAQEEYYKEFLLTDEALITGRNEVK